MIRTARAFLADRRGAIAAEFALVIPVLVLLIFGVLHMSLMLYSVSRLHDATEAAARCAAVSPYICTDVQAWAQSRYSGAAAASFTYSATGTCSYDPSTNAANGHMVTGTATYNFNAGLVNRDIPLSATACFP